MLTLHKMWSQYALFRSFQFVSLQILCLELIHTGFAYVQTVQKSLIEVWTAGVRPEGEILIHPSGYALSIPFWVSEQNRHSVMKVKRAWISFSVFLECLLSSLTQYSNPEDFLKLIACWRRHRGIISLCVLMACTTSLLKHLPYIFEIPHSRQFPKSPCCAEDRTSRPWRNWTFLKSVYSIQVTTWTFCSPGIYAVGHNSQNIAPNPRAKFGGNSRTLKSSDAKFSCSHLAACLSASDVCACVNQPNVGCF